MDMFEFIYSFFVLGLITVVLICEVYSRKVKIPPVPTLPRTKRQIIKLLQAHLDQKQPLNIAELGSGWGGVSRCIARYFPQAFITGFELSPPPYWVSRLCTRKKNIHFIQRDFYGENFSGFHAIICYLSPDHMRRLKDKFEAELPKNCIIISNAFPLPNWDSTQEIEVSHFGYKTSIYVYKR